MSSFYCVIKIASRRAWNSAPFVAIADKSCTKSPSSFNSLAKSLVKSFLFPKLNIIYFPFFSINKKCANDRQRIKKRKHPNHWFSLYILGQFHPIVNRSICHNYNRGGTFEQTKGSSKRAWLYASKNANAYWYRPKRLLKNRK